MCKGRLAGGERGQGRPAEDAWGPGDTVTALGQASGSLWPRESVLSQRPGRGAGADKMSSKDKPAKMSGPKSPVWGHCRGLDCPGKVARGQSSWDMSVVPSALPSAMSGQGIRPPGHWDRCRAPLGCL